jgi:hypothetical protein
MRESSDERKSIATLQQHFKFVPTHLQDILFEIRNLVLAVRPDASERIDARGLSYFDAHVGGTVKGAIAIAHIAEDHIQVHLIHGSHLPDPMSLLDGGHDAKYKRFVSIYSMESTNWEALRELIKAQNDYVQLHHL